MAMFPMKKEWKSVDVIGVEITNPSYWQLSIAPDATPDAPIAGTAS
ncbi:hypothetical protein [Rossellomorea sp. SC111]|nr:hypothetical protein [Rossellomorea sp. SC111]